MKIHHKKTWLMLILFLFVCMLGIGLGVYISTQASKSSPQNISENQLTGNSSSSTVSSNEDNTAVNESQSKPDPYLIGTVLVVVIGYPSAIFLLLFSKGNLSRKSYYFEPYKGTKEEDTDINYNCITLTDEPDHSEDSKDDQVRVFKDKF